MVPWRDIVTWVPDAEPADPDAFVTSLLPAVRRAAARSPRTEVPSHLLHLAERVGARWALTVAPDGGVHWLLGRRADDSEGVDRFLVRAGGGDWTVLASEGWADPGTLAIGLHHHLTLGASVSWLAAHPPRGSATHAFGPYDESLVDQVSRALLRPIPDGPPLPRALLVEVAPGAVSGVRVSRAGSLGGDRLLSDLPEVTAALAPWPGSRAVKPGTAEASWVPSLGLAVHYTRALHPDGLVVLWYPRNVVRETFSTPDRAMHLDWYRESGMPVVSTSTSTSVQAGDTRDEPTVLAALQRHVDLLTDGSLAAVQALPGWRTEVVDEGLRLVVRARKGGTVCAAVAGGDHTPAVPLSGCWAVP